MSRRKRSAQVTCWCSRYAFPHRLSGGRCHGREWCDSYYQWEHSLCRDCNCNSGTECEVATGAERLKYCEAVQEHMFYRSRERHPRESQDPCLTHHWPTKYETSERDVPF